MNKKIKFIFLIILILPTVIFSIYEIGSYRENEKVIETIYGNQLESILYSVNQYSDDVMSSWANRINVLSGDDPSNREQELDKFVEETPSVLCVIQYNDRLSPMSQSYLSEKKDLLKNQVQEVLTNNIGAIERLSTYLEVGYRKISSFKLEDKDQRLIVFLSKKGKEVVVNAVVVSPTRFIQEVLDPKIQEISQDKFYIGAFYKTEADIFYNSDKQYSPKKFEFSKPIWFFDMYHLGIELKNQTIKELVESRARKNIYLMIFVDLVLLFGAWLISRNVKKQMELTKIKADFISNVSHEIRTPLALISMYVETVEMNRVNSEEEKREYFAVIIQETRRLSNMVNKILDFSHLESGSHSYTFLPTNINLIVEEVVQIFKLKLEAENFTLQVHYDESLPEILADNDSITNAVINLVDNAMKYSATEKTIILSTFIKDDSIVIQVEDKGIGISDFDQKRIFDKFYRVTKKNLTQKTKGSGLGLALVKIVMDSHDGHIVLKSKLGEGSIFKLVFPIKT